MSAALPKLYIKTIVETKDGDYEIEYEPSKEFIKFAAKSLKKKKPTEAELNKFVSELLSDAAEGKNGYVFEVENEEDRLIDIVGWEDLPDGSAILTIDYSQEYAEIVAKAYSKKSATPEDVEKFVLESLEQGLKNADLNKPKRLAKKPKRSGKTVQRTGKKKQARKPR